nr:copper amine oxidase N-terminal domain-containing protein [Paenibacillus sabuli]
MSLTNGPVLKNGSNLIPLRELAEALDAKVTWYQKTSTIKVEREERRVTLTMSSTTVFYNGESETASAAPVMLHNVTYIPAQVMLRGLGIAMTYDATANALYLTT